MGFSGRWSTDGVPLNESTVSKRTILSCSKYSLAKGSLLRRGTARPFSTSDGEKGFPRKHSLAKTSPLVSFFKVKSFKRQPFAAWDRAAFVHERRREGVLTTIFPVSFATPFFPSPSSSPFPWRGCHLLLPDPVLSIFLVSPLFFALAQKPSWLWVES